MRILVTGGGGFIGTHLVRELRAGGHTVISLDRAHTEDEYGFSVRADRPIPQAVRADVAEYRQLFQVFEQLGPFDVVYHGAAEFGRWNGQDFYETCWRTNAIGTAHMLTLQAERRFRLVLCSSSEVYGDWHGVMSEDVTAEFPTFPMNDYALSKWVNERQVMNAARQHGTESVIVRFFNVYGPGEFYSPYRSANCRFLYCALHGLPFTVYRGHTRTSSYVADMLPTLATISERFKAGAIYNLAGSTPHTMEALAESVIKATGADPSLVQYASHEPMTTTDKRADVRRAIADLGHTERYGLEEGLQLTAAWMQQVYGLFPRIAIERKPCPTISV